MNKQKQEICHIYKKSVSENLEGVKNILASMDITFDGDKAIYKDLMNISSQKMVDKWANNKKYLRTEFVYKAFGKHYPRKMLKTSIMVDSMINILDDLLDENITKDSKMYYILEYLRVFSIYSDSFLSRKSLRAVSSYFNKLITLAIAEQKVMGLAKSENSLDKLVEYSYKLLLLRAMDIDVFVDFALEEYGDNINTKIIKRVARLFRAQNILKKDIYDLERDMEENQETLITLMYSKKSEVYNKYLADLLQVLNDKLEEKFNITDSTENIYSEPMKRFRSLFLQDTMEIEDYHGIKLHTVK